MRDFSDKNFGLIIAFWLPGFLCLWGLFYVSSVQDSWLQIANASENAKIGSFLYATVASLALGLLLNGIRWATVDQFLRLPFCRVPPFNEAIFHGNEKQLAAFSLIIEGHYRYYQFCAGALVAIVAVGVYAAVTGQPVPRETWATAAVVIGILFFAARDAMAKYCRRTQKIIDTIK
jgi:hypothetical protein